MSGYDFLQLSPRVTRSLPLAAIAPLALHPRIEQHIQSRCSTFAAGAFWAGRPSRGVRPGMSVTDIAVADAHGRDVLVSVTNGRPRPRAVSEHRLWRG